MTDFTGAIQSGLTEKIQTNILTSPDQSIVGKSQQVKILEVSNILSFAQINCITNTAYVETVGGTKDSIYYQEKFAHEKLEGMSSPIDLYGCHSELIQSQKHIQQFVDELCRELKWEKIGVTYMKYFDNEDPGITFKQRTDQGIISAHFKELTMGACIDIHSRNYHDPNVIAEYANNFFKAEQTILDVSYRQPFNGDDNQSLIQTTGGIKTIDYYQEKYESKNLWGISSAIDIHDCDLEKNALQKNITSKKYITEFVADLCEAIEMVTDGGTQVDEVMHFGKKGIEFTQVITTSLISGHFRCDTNSAYFEIFSCKFYDPNFVAKFVKNYFNGGVTKIQVSYRGIK